MGLMEMLASEDGQSDEADERGGWWITGCLCWMAAQMAAALESSWRKEERDQKGAPAASSRR